MENEELAEVTDEKLTEWYQDARIGLNPAWSHSRIMQLVAEVRRLKEDVRQLTDGRNAAEGEARQVHQDYEKLMAEVERLQGQRDKLEAMANRYLESIQGLLKERDEALADAERLRRLRQAGRT
jgi:chromosome segregation ATPase